MAKVKMTDLFLQGLEPDSDSKRRRQVYDVVVPGLVVRVSADGRKVFSMLYWHPGEGRRRRLTLGRWPALSLAKARVRARAVLNAVAAGEDPAGDKKKRREAVTFGDLLTEYEDYLIPNKRSGESDRYRIKKYLPDDWKWRKADEITRRDVVKALDPLTSKGKATMTNHVKGLISRIYTFGAERGLIAVGDNPTLGMRPIPTQPRDRVLSDEEIRRFWTRIEDGPIDTLTAIALKLVLLTGQRPGEVAGMVEEEVKGDLWTIPASRFKTAIDHVVPLPALALELMERAREIAGDSRFIFPGRGGEEPLSRGALSRAMRRSLPTLEFDAPATPHDLRRSARTAWARIGILTEIAERLLGHVVGGKMARTYDRHPYLEEKRAALLHWETKLREIVAWAETQAAESKAGNVVPLQRARA